MSQATETEIPKSMMDVLTLQEAAAYLRISDAEVIELATRQDLPGRKIGNQWRFLKQGLADWLLQAPKRDRLLRHAGVMKDDPNLQPMLKAIYEDRGRSISEESAGFC